MRQLAARIPDELKELVELTAEREDISQNSAVIVLLERGLGLRPGDIDDGLLPVSPAAPAVPAVTKKDV